MKREEGREAEAFIVVEESGGAPVPDRAAAKPKGSNTATEIIISKL
jgi:hypothetical protein